MKRLAALGEEAKRGEQDRVRDNARASGIMPPAPFADLNIPSQRATEMKRLAALGEEAITQAVPAPPCAGLRWCMGGCTGSARCNPSRLPCAPGVPPAPRGGADTRI